MGETLKAAPGGQVSLTDPDARAMSSHGKGRNNPVTVWKREQA